MRKCALSGKLYLAEPDSLLGQLHQQQREQGKGVRGRRLLKEELKRLAREVLEPAGLVDSTTGASADESISLKEWRKSARLQVRLNGAERQASELRKLSSLSLSLLTTAPTTLHLRAPVYFLYGRESCVTLVQSPQQYSPTRPFAG